MILVVSYPDEDHTDAVVDVLERQGREVVRIDLSDFPARAGLSLSHDGGSPRYEVTAGGRTVDLAAADVGWWRRVRGHEVDDALVEPGERAFAASETTQAVGGMLDALACSWVNPRAADDAAHRKPYQWAVARQAGLWVPPTLVTNSPDRAHAFVAAHGGVGRTVFKSLLASWDWRETRLVQPADLDRLDSVRFAPVIFQEYVPGVDLRITIVGDEVYAAEIDATATSYPVDMRMVIGEAAIRPVTLPPDVADALIALMKRLDLVYGAVDMRRTPDGRYAFLEVNPAGLWLFVEQRTGLPITDAVARRLAALDDEGRAR